MTRRAAAGRAIRSASHGIARHSPTLAIGFLIVLLFLLLAILADVIAPFNPTRGFPYAVLRPPGGGVDASQAVEALGMFLHHVGHQLAGQVPAAGQAQAPDLGGDQEGALDAGGVEHGQHLLVGHARHQARLAADHLGPETV